MRRSFLFVILIGYSVGLVLGSRFFASVLVMCGSIITAGLMLWSRRWRFVGWAMLAIISGFLRWQGMVAEATASTSPYIGKMVAMTGIVGDIPVLANGAQTITLRSVAVRNQPIAGAIGVVLPSYPTHRMNERLSIECEWKRFEGTTHYRRLIHDIRAWCAAGSSRAVAPSPVDIRNVLGLLKNGIFEIVTRNWSEPQASFLVGLLLGGGGNMPTDLNQDFQTTGTTHIIALSGFNVTIIVAVISAVMIRWCGRRWAWIPSLAVVILFVVMTGASASVVRAAIMAVIAQAAIFFGRPVAMSRLLILTALTMLIVNPFILEFDLGFQLSFLATLGIVYVSRPLATRFSWLTEHFSIRENAAATMGAMLVTEPWIIWAFGRFSLISPFINIAVLPFIPLAMGMGAVTVLLAWCAPPVGRLMIPVTDALLRGILAVIHHGAQSTFASLHLPWFAAGAVAAGCIIILVRLLLTYDQTLSH